MRARKKWFCDGWFLSHYKFCDGYFITVPTGTDVSHILVFLHTVPGGSGILIVNDALEGTEVFFRCELKFNDVFSLLSSSLEIEPQKRIKKKKIVPRILQYTTDWVFIKEWCSMTEVSRELGINIGNLYNAATGKTKTAGGYCWKIKE